MTTITIPAGRARTGDRLDDGTIVYDTAPAALAPGHVVIASASNGASRAQVMAHDDLVEVTRR